ncbi:hypothetical protein BDP27DRAFT_1320686, partial [Rhodocollybia butyracea]
MVQRLKPSDFHAATTSSAHCSLSVPVTRPQLNQSLLTVSSPHGSGEPWTMKRWYAYVQVFCCFFHGCNKQYRSRQTRDKHFDSIHLGMRFMCRLCGSPFMNQNSVTRHEAQRCPSA